MGIIFQTVLLLKVYALNDIISIAKETRQNAASLLWEKAELLPWKSVANTFLLRFVRKRLSHSCFRQV